MPTLLSKKQSPFKRSKYISTILLCCLLIWASTGSAGAGMGKDPANLQFINDYKSLALISLKNMPQLQRSRIEIELQLLNEDDSRWSYFPTLTLSGSYYFSEDDGNISLNVGNYKPWESYFSIKAQKLITRIVQLYHIKATSDILHRLAETLLEVMAYDQIDKEYEQIIQLYSKRFEYVRHRALSPETIPLELEYEQRANELVLAEKKGNLVRRDTLLHRLSTAMNIPDSHVIELNASQTLDQILGAGEPDRSFDGPRPEPSFRHKIFTIKLVLQEKKILLARAKYLPSFSLGLRSPDILNTNDEDREYYLFAGINLTLWDGNKRARDITRQKMVLGKMELEKKEIESDDTLEWLDAMRRATLKKSEHAIALSAEKVRLLEKKRKQYEYDNGTIRLPDLLNEKISFHRDRIQIISKKLEFNKAILNLRYLSGDLLNNTVNISFDPNAHEQITPADQ